jgi:hypothetical protein
MFNPRNGNVRDLSMSAAKPRARTVHVQTVAIFHPKIIRARETEADDVFPIIASTYFF